ncbi:unnamed protein product [Phyllotreta striolata]|uniref:Regulatory protein zeste n=1 Tax=Phyllotreta striolata TaxID=444603 RepID=A0A9N9T9W3_PHYSR|nr:unnamed protein product [Phyllotreta striolata]
MEKSKRDRSQNFTNCETNLLVALVIEYSRVIESKKPDASTWKQKETAWNNLAAEYNKKTRGPSRTAKCLKTKYESLKKNIKKKMQQRNFVSLPAESGEDVGNGLSPVEEKVYALMQSSVDGLPPLNDDDYKLYDTSPGDMVEPKAEVNTPEDALGPEMQVVELYENESDSMPSNYELDEEPQGAVVFENNHKDLFKDDTVDSNWSKWHASRKRRKNQAAHIETQKLLASKKIELIELQKKVIQSEIDYKKQEDEIKLKKLNIELATAEVILQTHKIEKEIKEQTLKKLLESSTLKEI